MRSRVRSRIQLSLTKSSLRGQLAALLGEPPTAPLDFAPTIDLAAGYGRSLARYVLTAVADLEQLGSVLWSPDDNEHIRAVHYYGTAGFASAQLQRRTATSREADCAA